MEIIPQNQFPHLKRFQEKFPITDKTIFAWDNVIYSNYPVSEDLIIHEKTHHSQQKRDGLNYWLDNYLNNTKYRLCQEIEAYRNQIKSIKHPKLKILVTEESIKHLKSGLYGDIIDGINLRKEILK